MEALPHNRECDRWHQAMKDDNIWHRRFSEGIVESETMPTRSTLAHIYMVMSRQRRSEPVHPSDPPRGPLVLHRARNARIRFKQRIDFFYSRQLRGRRPTRLQKLKNESDPPSEVFLSCTARAALAFD